MEDDLARYLNDVRTVSAAAVVATQRDRRLLEADEQIDVEPRGVPEEANASSSQNLEGDHK